MTKGNLTELLNGFFEWKRKIEETGNPILEEDFYDSLRKMVDKLSESKDDREMADVLNCIGRIYFTGGYNVNFRGCYDRLKEKEGKDETR